MLTTPARSLVTLRTNWRLVRTSSLDRSIVPVVKLGERGELFAALFTLSYLAFGLPTVLAGVAVGSFGLTPTTLGYGAIIVVFSNSCGSSW